MKILQVLVKDTIGGAEVLTLGLAREYETFGHESHLIILGRPGSLNTKFKSVFKTVTYLELKFSPITWANSIIKFKRAIASLNPDLIHSHLFIANFFSLLFSPRRIKQIITLHSSGLENESTFTKLIAIMIRPLLKPKTVVTACSNSAKALGVRLGYGSNIQVIPNGIEIHDCLPKPSISSKAFISLARLHPMKDHSNLFAAFKIFAQTHPDWRLDCAGTGVSMENPEMKSLISKLRIDALIESGQIRLLGPIDNPINILPNYSAMIFSSQSGEALPMAGIEALSVGLPVIGTDVGDLKEIVPHLDLLVSHGNPAELANAMMKLESYPIQDFEVLSKTILSQALRNYAIRKTAMSYLELAQKIE